MAMNNIRFLFRFVLIYALDWVVIVGTIAFAGSMSFWATPNARPFSLDDPSIQFPYQANSKVPTWLLVVLAGFLPALSILALTLILPAYSWRRKLYSLNTALLGLGLAIATGMIVTDGLKNLAGKPRPDMISRCDPDRERIEEYTIGPGGLVDWEICRNRHLIDSGSLDESDLRDGFRSFPSGHCSMSFAGLTYLSMFLAEFVFALPFPSLQATPVTAPIISSPSADTHKSRRRSRHRKPRTKTEMMEPLLPRFPIMFALLVCAIPILLAIYISSTRYSDFRHHPFDAIFGAVLGLFAGYTGWRWYGGWSCAGEGGRRGLDVNGITLDVDSRRRGGLRGGDMSADETGSDERDTELRKVTDRRREVVPPSQDEAVDLESGNGWRDSRAPPMPPRPTHGEPF